jgi:hypothetical protein
MANTLTCIEDEIAFIDKKLFAGLPIDAKYSYGVATRQHTYNGKVINVSTNELLPTDGEVALWDDRYSVIWFHRVNSSSIETSENGRTGRVKSSVRENLDIDLVVWAAVKYRNNGQFENTTQMELYRRFAAILIYQTTAEVSYVDFDMPAIGRSEFIENRIHKESLLFKMNYKLCRNIPKECFCPPPPDECEI